MTYTLSVIALIIGYKRKDLLWEMFWAGTFSLPLFLLTIFISYDFPAIALKNGGLFFYVEKILNMFLFGAISSALYELTFHKKLTPVRHPERKKFYWLATGPLVLILGKIIFNQSLILSLILALSVDILITLFIRKDLIWDALFSGISMGILYTIILLLFLGKMPGDYESLWFMSGFTGITLASIPIEEIISIALFGSLWGPLYLSVKDLKLKDD